MKNIKFLGSFSWYCQYMCWKVLPLFCNWLSEKLVLTLSSSWKNIIRRINGSVTKNWVGKVIYIALLFRFFLLIDSLFVFPVIYNIIFSVYIVILAVIDAFALALRRFHTSYLVIVVSKSCCNLGSFDVTYKVQASQWIVQFFCKDYKDKLED